MRFSSEPWWRKCSAVLRYMPEQDRKTIAEISAELPETAAAGYQAIQITAPYCSAGFHAWWGLCPYDYFSVNSALGGTIEDFTALVDECHRHGLHVILFINIGYGDITSPLWQTACSNRRKGHPGKEDALFLWSKTDQAPLPKRETPYFLHGGSWQWSSDAEEFYYGFWQVNDLREPMFDWQSPAFHAYVRDILGYWLSTGADGFIIDAPNWYLNGSFPVLRRCITNVIHRHPGVMCIPEGGAGYGDSFVPWLTEAGFDMLEDQTFESDLHWNGSAVMNALRLESPALLDNALAVCRAVRAMGSACWSYIGWGDAWTPERRLLEIAILLASGHMTEIIPSHLLGFLPEHHEILHRILRMTKYEAVAPCNERIRLFTVAPESCYAFLCPSDETPVLCVFNLSEMPREMWLSISENSLPEVSGWYDAAAQRLLNIGADCLYFSLPACGFALAVPIA